MAVIVTCLAARGTRFIEVFSWNVFSWESILFPTHQTW